MTKVASTMTREETIKVAVQASSSAPVGDHASRYLNRELSWLQFNRRVLGEALSDRHPLLERVKFLAIFSSNLDEFFMVRVSGIHEQIEARVSTMTVDGKLPSEQLALLRPVVDELVTTQHRYWVNYVLPQLRAQGILIRDYAELDEAQRVAAREMFNEQIYPVLTPLAFDLGHPFPHISNLSLNLAV